MCLLFCLQSLLPGLRLRGKVVDCDNGEPLPYATIKVRNRYGGAIADTAGVFELYGRFQAGDTVVVSYVGYKAADVIAGSLAVDSACTAIRLEPLVMPLPEMSVRPKKQKRKKSREEICHGYVFLLFQWQDSGGRLWAMNFIQRRVVRCGSTGLACM